MLDFIPAVLLALDALVPEVWAAVFRESTSPKPILVGLSLEVLDRGIGDIGHISIPSFIWHAVAPDDTLEIASRQLRNIRGISSEGLVMARALVRDGVLAPCQAALPPNGWLFPVPKNSEKASMIVHLVEFNRQHYSKPPSFSLPVVEHLASLIQLHFLHESRGFFDLPLGADAYLNDPFLRALRSLKPSASPGDELLACHVDLKNAFWSLRLPEEFRQTFHVRRDMGRGAGAGGADGGVHCCGFQVQFVRVQESVGRAQTPPRCADVDECVVYPKGTTSPAKRARSAPRGGGVPHTVAWCRWCEPHGPADEAGWPPDDMGPRSACVCAPVRGCECVRNGQGSSFDGCYWVVRAVTPHFL